MFSSIRRFSTKVNSQVLKVIIGDTEHTYYKTYQQGAVETFVTIDKNVTIKYWEITKKIEPKMIISNKERKLYLYKDSQEKTVDAVIRENGIDEPCYVKDKSEFTSGECAMISIGIITLILSCICITN